MSSAPTPRISVVILGGDPRAALTSLTSLHEQEPLELLVACSDADDVAGEAARALLVERGARILPAGSATDGCRMADTVAVGELLCFVRAGERLTPGALARLASEMDGAAAAWGDAMIERCGGIRHSPAPDNTWRLTQKRPIGPVMVRRDALDAHQWERSLADPVWELLVALGDAGEDLATVSGDPLAVVPETLLGSRRQRAARRQIAARHRELWRQRRRLAREDGIGIVEQLGLRGVAVGNSHLYALVLAVFAVGASISGLLVGFLVPNELRCGAEGCGAVAIHALLAQLIGIAGFALVVLFGLRIGARRLGLAVNVDPLALLLALVLCGPALVSAGAALAGPAGAIGALLAGALSFALLAERFWLVAAPTPRPAVGR